MTQYDWSGFKDATTKREFEFLNILGTAALEAADLSQVTIFEKITNRVLISYRNKYITDQPIGCRYGDGLFHG